MLTRANDMVWALRTVTPLLPAQTGNLDGLAHTLWLPPPPQPAPRAGIVVIHGADSAKESHHDFARAAVALGFAVICFDQRGHGETGGALGSGAGPVRDVVTMAGRLRAALGRADAPIALRGSSMGGYLAIRAAGPTRASAVVAICPASGEGLRRGLDEGRFDFAADEAPLRAFLDAEDLTATVASLTAPLLLMHAEGDERVPVEHSRELAAVMRA
ncbi:MAG: alpha/beta fold hydrolase, partial [Solirubrobacteraceae bacterium]